MKIELITVWYNEAFLAPFFLDYYRWVDRIHILLDADTDDDTEAIAARYPNVSVEKFCFPDMMDDLIKSRKINEKYRSITDADYIIVVDSDEFIVCNRLEDLIKAHIAAKGKSLYFATMWQVYQHQTEGILDAAKPVMQQRRHGDPTIANCNIKPTIARTGLDLVWGVGNHSVVLDGKPVSWLTPNAASMAKLGVAVQPSDLLQGAHWRLFDLDQVIIRRTRNRTARQSRVNLATNLSSHLHKTSAEAIRNEYQQMKTCPVVIKDRICINSTQATSIFDALLAEPAFTDNLPVNDYPSGVSHLYESCALPDWYTMVKPQSSQESLAEETLVLACTYHKAGEPEKAITLLKKALALAPDSEHCRFYLQQLQTELSAHKPL